jgi:hypothetical protein
MVFALHCTEKTKVGTPPHQSNPIHLSTSSYIQPKPNNMYLMVRKERKEWYQSMSIYRRAKKRNHRSSSLSNSLLMIVKVIVQANPSFD